MDKKLVVINYQGHNIQFYVDNKTYGIGTVIPYNDKNYQVVTEDSITIIAKEIPDLTDKEFIKTIKRLASDTPLTKDQLDEIYQNSVVRRAKFKRD